MTATALALCAARVPAASSTAGKQSLIVSCGGLPLLLARPRRPSGEMVDAADSKSVVERRVGSSPTWGTKREFCEVARLDRAI